MKLKTSTAIALKFTGYVSFILFLFGLGINITSFGQQYNNEVNKINMEMIKKDRKAISSPTMMKARFERRDDRPISIAYEEKIIKELNKNRVFGRVSKIDDIYLIYNYNQKEIKINNISHLIEIQNELISITLLTIFLGAILTFILSRNFVKSSLKDINKLVHYVQTIDIHNLTSPVPLSGPEDDEIRIIAQTLQSSLNTIKTQTDSLKDFVSYASHELKTPISTIHGVVDLAEKTGKYNDLTPKIKKTLTEMTNLLDTLLLITKREFQSIKKEKIDMVDLLHDISTEISEQYKDKAISHISQLPKEYHIDGQYDIIKIIITNIIKNAYKFTPSQGIITTSMVGNKLIIQDNGKGIQEEDQEKIRQRFWKKGTTEETGYGLGLYMVKLLVEKLGRTIAMKSKKDIGTTFTITMK